METGKTEDVVKRIREARKTVDMTADQCEKIAAALYQIHGIASFVIGVGDSLDAVTGKGISEPVASIAQAIQEKAEYCLAILDKKEAAA